jgi:hypothetical protein
MWLGSSAGCGVGSGSKCVPSQRSRPLHDTHPYVKSQAVLEHAKKDLGSVVTQAQREFGKFTQPSETSAESETSPATGSAAPETQVQDIPSHDEEGSLSSSVVTERGEPSSPSMSTSPSQSIFARLQSALPPNIVSTVQNNIPESLKHASERIDLAHLRSEFQRVQGVTRAQAEEYVHKSEALLREAMKEAGEVLKDVVKVVPPEEAEAPAGVVWDGTDMWMLPTAGLESSDRASWSSEKGKESGSASARRAVATRAEALLKKLKHDPEIIGHEMENDDVFEQWVKVNVDSNEAGIKSSEWTERAEQALAETVDGTALRTTHDHLGKSQPHKATICASTNTVSVPGRLSEETFWKRYFFRVNQIEREEERRKSLLKGKSLSSIHCSPS